MTWKNDRPMLRGKEGKMEGGEIDGAFTLTKC